MKDIIQVQDEFPECQRTCRNSCDMLNEALRRETVLLQFYEHVAGQCDYPDVKNFIQDLVEQRRKPIVEIVSKLNEIRAKSQIMDGVISSFNRT